MKKVNNKGGFTLIEIIVVLIIIGILAAIALPNLFSNVQTSQGASALQTANAMESPIESCMAKYNALPGVGACAFNGAASEMDLSNASGVATANAGVVGYTVDVVDAAGVPSAGDAVYTLEGALGGTHVFYLNRPATGVFACVPGASPYNNVC